jgi:hypothetical protein
MTTLSSKREEEGDYRDITAETESLLLKSQTHMTQLGVFRDKLLKWSTIEIVSLNISKAVYEHAGRTEVSTEIQKRINELKTICEMTDDIGDSLAGDFMEIFFMLGATEKVEDEDGEDDEE